MGRRTASARRAVQFREDDGFPAALVIGLEAAVPLHILDAQHRTDEQRVAAANDLGTVIGSHGDDLIYGGRHCAATFNALARGLALLAYQPGGVDFAGHHWCTTPHEGCPNRRRHDERADSA
jgi:hypothetical protein